MGNINLKDVKDKVLKLWQQCTVFFKNFRHKSSSSVNHEFVDLMPINNADENGIYTHALSFALESRQIRNVAVTGPYGAGKSSVLKTFERKNSKFKFLNISLATFADAQKMYETDPSQVQATQKSIVKVQHELIEKSILQQMIYSVKANKLPYSRYNRIKSPNLFAVIFYPIAICIWGFLLYFLPKKLEHILNLIDSNEFVFDKWAVGGIAFFILSCVFINKIYKLLFNKNIKQLSLTSAEIEASSLDADSILNKNIDEILYFFQVTRTNVVIIEDLDRFGDTEIFIKLREINKLVNDYLKETIPIVFIYAIKDDIFTSLDRTKFFDFIIPVIPVVNNSTALELMYANLGRVGLKDYFQDDDNMQFLREVSIYFNDLRIINNIFNEFLIYQKIIIEDADMIDPIKMLAMLVYKNAYPFDFEKLHHGEGLFSTICAKRMSFLELQKASLEKELVSLRAHLSNVQKEILDSVEQLASLYCMCIFRKARGLDDPNVTYYNILITDETSPNTYKTIAPISSATIEHFHTIEGKNIYVSGPHSRPGQYTSLGNFDNIINIVHPGMTVQDKIDAIHDSAANRVENILIDIKELEGKIANLHLLSFGDLIKSQPEFFEQILNDHNWNNLGIKTDLFEYLIKSNYLDHNFDLLISPFYEGRLSFNDRNVLAAIRINKKLEVDQIINNPADVCNNLRLELFETEFVLILELITFIFQTPDANIERKNRIICYLNRNLDYCTVFLRKYFDISSPEHIKNLLNLLFSNNTDFMDTLLSSSIKHQMLFLALNYIDEKFFINNESKKLSDTLNKEIESVLHFGSFSHDVLSLLKKLKVSVKSIASLRENPSYYLSIYENDLYEINTGNVFFILKNIEKNSSEDMIESANLTCIMESKSKLLSYIELHFRNYFNDVWLKLKNNKKESEDAILKLLSIPDLEIENKTTIIKSQDHIFNDISVLSADLWDFVIENGKIEPNWENFSNLFAPDTDNELATKFLNQSDIVEVLSTKKFCIKNNENEPKALYFIFSNNDLTDDNYAVLIQSIGLHIDFSYDFFPSDISDEKKHLLIEHNIVNLTPESYSISSPNLQAGLVKKHWKTYLENKSTYILSPKVLSILFSADDFDDSKKLLLSLDLSPTDISENYNFSDSVAKVMMHKKASVDQYLPEFILVILRHLSSENQDLIIGFITKFMVKIDYISLKNKLLTLDEVYKKFGDDTCTEVTVPNNPISKSFTTALRSAGFISTVEIVNNELLAKKTTANNSNKNTS